MVLDEPTAADHGDVLYEIGKVLMNTGVYNLLNKTRISCGKILETFWENVEAYARSLEIKLCFLKY